MPGLSKRWSRRASTVSGLLAALVVTLACGLGGRVDAPVNQPAGQPAPSRSSPGQPGQDEDGTKSPQEFANDIKGAVSIAEQYWGKRFRTDGQRFEPVRQIIPYERDGEVDCGGEAVPRNNAVYCPQGDFIAYDVNWATQEFQNIGDAFLFYLLGHEYAHGIQVRLGIRYEFTIQQELQADCMAGAYIADSVKARTLVLQDGDLDELRQGLIEVADDPGQPWFAEGSHGTAKQRTDAFFAGYRRSLAGCDLR